MLKRRTRAYGSSCSHLILVYLHPFRRNSRLKLRAKEMDISSTLAIDLKAWEELYILRQAYVTKPL